MFIAVSSTFFLGRLPAATAQTDSKPTNAPATSMVAIPESVATAPQTDPIPRPPTVSASTSNLPSPQTERVTLEAAIERALHRNPSSQIAVLEMARAEALVRQARAASFPTLTGNATYTHLDSDRVSTTGTFRRVVAAQDQFNANAVLQVPLFAPARWAQWSHAKDNAQLITESSEDTRRQLAIAVARNFLAVVSQHRVIEVGERAVEVSRSHDEYAKTRMSGGVGNRLDAVRSSQQLATNVATLERSRIGLVRAMEALGVLLGEERPIDVAIEPTLDAPRNEVDMNQAVERRKDVAIARLKVKTLTRISKDSWLDYLPLLVGQFQPFYQNPPTMTQPKTGWQALLLLTIPLYDGGARYGAADERRVLKDQSEQQLQSLLRQSRSEVRVAFEAVRNAERALDAAETAATLAREAETMAHLAYEAGATTNLEVIDAERRTHDANTDVLVAEDTLRQSKLDLLVASGRFPAKR
jgi:outer membrane protein TolC